MGANLRNFLFAIPRCDRNHNMTIACRCVGRKSLRGAVSMSGLHANYEMCDVWQEWQCWHQARFKIHIALFVVACCTAACSSSGKERACIVKVKSLRASRVNHNQSKSRFLKVAQSLHVHFGNVWRTFVRLGRIVINILPRRTLCVPAMWLGSHHDV